MKHTPWTGTVTRYDCGCSIDQDKVGACSIAYCPAHDAAPELLEVLEDIVHKTQFVPTATGIRADVSFAQIDKANAAIAKTRG